MANLTDADIEMLMDKMLPKVIQGSVTAILTILQDQQGGGEPAPGEGGELPPDPVDGGDGDGDGDGDDLVDDQDGDGVVDDMDGDQDGDGVGDELDDDQDGDGVPNDLDDDEDEPAPPAAPSRTRNSRGPAPAPRRNSAAAPAAGSVTIPSSRGQRTMQRNSQQNGNGNGGGGRRIADRINGAGGAPRLTRFQRELVESNRQLQAEVLELKRFNRAATRRTDLVELENAGFVLDVEDELARLTDMDETRYDRELDRIIKRYQRLPVNQRPIPIADPDEEVATERPGDPDEELFAYAQEHGLKGEEAMRRFRQDKGKGRDTQPAGKGGDGQRLRRS